MKNSKEYFVAEYKANDAYMSDQTKNLFEAGFDFAMSQPKHLRDTDYPVHVGDVRRYKGSLYEAVEYGDGDYCHKCEFNKVCDGEYPCGNGVYFVKVDEI